MKLSFLPKTASESPVNIRWALHEDLVQIVQEGTKLTFLNFRLLNIKMVIENGELFLESGKEKIAVDNLQNFIKFIK